MKMNSEETRSFLFCDISYVNPNWRGKRKGRDLSPIVMIFGVVRPIPPPFPNGKGAGRLMAVTVFQVKAWFEEHIASPPWGRRERGFQLERG